MSVEFRQRTAGEFIRMLKRRKWLIILPVITMTAAIGYVVSQLPSVYESKTLLTVKPPTISEKFVQSLTDEDLSQRLQAINTEVLSRNSLEPLISKYNLFKFERDAGVPMELIVEKMSKNIVVETEKNDEDHKTAAFKITYRDRTPEAARSVTADLAGKYVNAQIKTSTNSAEATSEFLQTQLTEAKTSLDALEKQRFDIMARNVETLPDSAQGLIAQLTALSTKRDSLTKEKQDLINDKGRINDQIGANNRQINTIETLVNKDLQEAAKLASRFEDTPAYAELIKKQAELEGSLKSLRTQYKEANPKVIEAQNSLDEVNRSLEYLKKNAQKKEDEAVNRGSRQTEIQKQGFVAENKRLQDNLARDEQQISSKEQEIAAVSGETNDINSKINQIPNVKVALDGVNNQYQSVRATYEDRLKKFNDAQQQVDREKNRQGETIDVQDAANLPSSPVAPKRSLLTALGAGIGLALGLFLAAAFELPRVLKIQNIEDAKHYTGLPILASVPPLLSHDEKTWRTRYYWLKVWVGFVIAIGAIPVIVIVLQASRIFERVMS
ncbi:MAG: Wzz/FepE/Etk N-terminal domain-containing protein [Acidobacteriota bacterium]|nr:Wzz/FepE/Etk N-terminal domain-containing protein [Acidobacteriota bacterium]